MPRRWMTVTAILTLAVALLAGFAPYVQPPAVAVQPVDSVLPVPVIAQRFSPPEAIGRGITDSGEYNCLPASVAMVLQALASDGRSDEERYQEVRQAFRNSVGQQGKLSPYLAEELVPGLTGGAVSASVVIPDESSSDC